MERRNSYCRAGGGETSMEAWRADPSSTRSISPVTCCIRKDPPAMDAGDMGGEGETVAAELAAVKQTWRRGGQTRVRPTRSCLLPAVSVNIHLLWMQGMWERKGKQLRRSWQP
jgi:hypothetical protein